VLLCVCSVTLRTTTGALNYAGKEDCGEFGLLPLTDDGLMEHLRRRKLHKTFC